MVDRSIYPGGIVVLDEKAWLKDMLYRYHEEHFKQWDWLAKHPKRTIKDYFRYYKNKRIVTIEENKNLMFPCRYVEVNRQPCCPAPCDLCPIQWKSVETGERCLCNDIDSLLTRYNFMQNLEERSILAYKIRNLVWRDNDGNVVDDYYFMQAGHWELWNSKTEKPLHTKDELLDVIYKYSGDFIYKAHKGQVNIPDCSCFACEWDSLQRQVNKGETCGFFPVVHYEGGKRYQGNEIFSCEKHNDVYEEWSMLVSRFSTSYIIPTKIYLRLQSLAKQIRDIEWKPLKR